MRLLTLIVCLASAAPCCAGVTLRETAPAGGLSSAFEMAGAAGGLDDWLMRLPAPGFAGDAPPTPARVEALPDTPDSASLFLVALASAGVWQLGRSTRKIHLGAMPEWYHAGGPAQVGHATPLELTFTDASLAVCLFDTASQADITRRFIPAPNLSLTPQLAALTAIEPRGPPCR